MKEDVFDVIVMFKVRGVLVIGIMVVFGFVFVVKDIEIDDVMEFCCRLEDIK